MKTERKQMVRVGWCLVMLILMSCTGLSPELRLAEQLVQEQDWDRAVMAYRAILRQDPFNEELMQTFATIKARAAEHHFTRGQTFLKTKRLPEALHEFQVALGLNPEKPEHHNALADAVRLKDAQIALQDAEKLRNLGRLDEALTRYERAIELDPDLSTALDGITAITEAQKTNKHIGGHAEFVTLRFQNTRLKQVFEILARTANINIIFEKDVRDDLITIFTKDLPFDEALHLILTTNQLFSRRVSSDTILIIPDTKQKRLQFEELKIRTFYLANAKAKDMANLLRTILETKRVYVNEPLNTIVVRDKPAKLYLAEQIILANDRRDAEVVLDVEILEVNRTKQRKLGAGFAKQASAAVVPSGAASFTYRTLTNLSLDSYLFTFPSKITFDFFKTESNAKTLASPQIRVLNNQKASINVGDKQPILLSTTNTVPNSGVGQVSTQSTVTSIEFKDTGTKLDIEPTIHLTGDITIKLKIEVTSLGNLVTLQSDPLIEQFRFGTRTAETTLNLRDGETVILAGLIQEEDKKTRSSIPGIDDLPILKDLFSNQTDQVTTEIVIAITPRIIRNVTPPSLADQTLWSGTANQFATAPLFSRQESVPLPLYAQELGDPHEQKEEKLLPPVMIPDTTSSSSFADPIKPKTPESTTHLPSPPQQPATVIVTPSQMTTHVGQTIQFTIMAEALPAVETIDLTLTYDSTILDFHKALAGNLWEKEENDSSLNVSVSPQTGQMTLHLGRSTKTKKTHGRLVTLEFIAKATGESPLVLSKPRLSQDGSGELLPVTAQHGLILVL